MRPPARRCSEGLVVNPDYAPPPARLRMLARMVERLGASSRADPEQVTLGKFLIGAQLRRLARELEG
jgi:hypothetical protein